MKWEVIYFVTSSNRSPVKDFIDMLDEKTQIRVRGVFDLLEEFGVNVGAPHVKKLSGSDLWEIRILGEKSLRFFYVAIINRKFLILHGFKKKSQQTPKNEIKIAVKRYKEFKKMN